MNFTNTYIIFSRSSFLKTQACKQSCWFRLWPSPASKRELAGGLPLAWLAICPIFFPDWERFLGYEIFSFKIQTVPANQDKWLIPHPFPREALQHGQQNWVGPKEWRQFSLGIWHGDATTKHKGSLGIGKAGTYPKPFHISSCFQMKCFSWNRGLKTPFCCPRH